MAKNVFKILAVLIFTFQGNCFSVENVDDFYFLNNENSLFSTSDTVKQKKEKDKPSAKKKMNPYKKVNFETFDQNYARAQRYYDNGQYLSAARIFEELYPLSMGTPMADTILFLFADCYYKNHDYEMAAFHFKDYTRRFPGTERTELAHFRCVSAIYNTSPYYSLDQSSTLYAIEEVNLFIQLYPRSNYVADCNRMLDEMREKLAQKDFEIIKLYYNTDNYQATQIAVKNFLKAYSYSKFAPESVLILIKNNYEYAKNSVVSKKVERYQACMDAFEVMQTQYGTSPYFAEAKKVAEDSKKQLEKLNK